MFRILTSALRIGRVTESLETLEAAAPPAGKGRPNLDVDRCDGNGACQIACPTTAIVLGAPRPDGNRSFTLDYGACVFCGRCAEACVPVALTMTGDYALAALRRQDLVLRVEVPFPSGNREGPSNA
jgi:hydrogenase-4 component H